MSAPGRGAITWLFVPGSRPDRFDRAAAAGADEVILDLEDAVAPDAKPAARDAVVDWLASGRAWVRVNAVGSAWVDDDLRALVGLPGLRGVVLPKSERADEVGRVATRLADHRTGDGPPVGLVPLVESGLGVADARQVAAVPGVTRLAFGSIDFALDVGAVEEPDSLLLARSSLVVASRAAAVAPPLDGVTADVSDHGLARADADRARRLGFGGKLCVHPRQLAPVREAFAPSDAELGWARGVLAAAEAAPPGEAFSHDGAMVDAPVLARARALLAGAPEGDR